MIVSVEQIIENPALVYDLGTFAIVVLFIVSAAVYFAPLVKKAITQRMDFNERLETIIQNCTAAINNNTEALHNNSEALRDNNKERNKLEAILREHDRAIEIQFQHQNETLQRIEEKKG